MYKIFQEQDFEIRPRGTVKFEGISYGAHTSFFHVKSEPNKGSSLHKHPYPETWIVRAGKVRFTVGNQQVEAKEGHIIIAEANIPHKYLNIGTDILELFCIHPSPEILQESIEE